MGKGSKFYRSPKKKPEPAEVNYVQAVTYEDGCAKSKWQNFHENGHQHVCVCGTYNPHGEFSGIIRIMETLTYLRNSAHRSHNDPFSVMLDSCENRTCTFLRIMAYAVVA